MIQCISANANRLPLQASQAKPSPNSTAGSSQPASPPRVARAQAGAALHGVRVQPQRDAASRVMTPRASQVKLLAHRQPGHGASPALG